MRRACCGVWLLSCLAGCVPSTLDRVREYNEDGVYLFERGDYRSARESFQAALTLTPDDPALLCNVAQCYDRAGDATNAERSYRECLRLAPNHIECRHALDGMLVRIGRRDEAARLIQEWLAREPRLAAAYAEDGWLLHQGGDLPGAQARLQQALALDPHDTRALVELARVYEAMRRPDRAADLYERALQQNPHQEEVARRLQLLRAQGAGRPQPE
jgi:protein O-GlcNAc transferase